MIKRISILLAILLFFYSLAQNQRFIYEYSFKPDSINKETVIKEIMNLDVTKEGSLFYSQLLLDQDSIFNAQIEQGKKTGIRILDGRKIKRSQANFLVSKKYPNYQTSFHTSFNALNLSVNEDKTINWIILPEIKTIEGHKVQKAKTNFVGRNWIAWFTNDIQIQDGPYKFSGLPGLILNIEDENGDHIFNIVGIKKQFYKTYLLKSKEIVVTEEKFNKLWNEYKKDPAKNIKMIHSSSEMSETLFYDSTTKNPLTKEDLIRNKEEGDRKYFKYYNNFIELKLYE